MPGIKITPERVTFTQSWLGTWLECPEKARWDIHNTSRDHDYHILGTALHYFIEAVLYGDQLKTARDGTVDWLNEQAVNNTFDYVKTMQLSTLQNHLLACMTAFETDVFPHLNPLADLEQAIEHKLSAPLIVAEDGTELHLEGTPDYKDRFLDQLDWKTTADVWDRYRISEKRKWAIQPTAYTYLDLWAQHGEELWQHSDVPFTFVVHKKGPRPSPVQWVDVKRGPQDWRHLQRVALRAYESISKDCWPISDQSHLCSENYCPNWGSCKGSTTVELQPRNPTQVSHNHTTQGNNT